jgi:non-homologous end joining protein Ku
MARAIWSGSISFGMVSIPVKLYGATESKDISFHLLHATCGTRLQQRRWCPTDEVDVPWSETARGYEYAKGQYVMLTDEDFERLPLPSKHMRLRPSPSARRNSCVPSGRTRAPSCWRLCTIRTRSGWSEAWI